MMVQTKKSMEANGAVDPAFKGISRTSTAFLIWRVQNLQLVPVPKEQYGTFYDGDSYIIYAASEYGKHGNPNTKPRDVKGNLEMHIHFWLGNNTSQDESAVAAFKSVELDNYLGGKPVQHREVRGNESSRFKAYFKNGIRILLGGFDSGLKVVNNNFEPRLFQVKGRRRPLVTQMPAVAWEYFNSGDAFIIDTKDVVFVWIGRTSNSMERLQAAKVATQFRDERNALSIVFVDDGKEMELPSPEQTLLGFYLDLRPLAKRVMPEVNGVDEHVEQEIRSQLKFYRCSDDDGIYKVTEVKTGSLSQSDLDPKDSYIIDNGPYHIWVWIGRNASSKERIEAMRNANGFLKKKNYPVTCRVSRVVDGGEPAEFRVLFPSWEVREPIQSPKAASPKIQPIAVQNLSSLETNTSLAAKEQILDNGSGNLKVWRVSKTNLVEVEKNSILFSSEIYYLLYTYPYNGSNKEILYYWLGSVSKENAQTQLTVSQEDLVAKANVKARILQCNQPPHFLVAFKGKLVIMDGEHKENMPKTYLLQIRGNQIFNTYAQQKPLERTSLNSNHVYLLKTESECYLWCGKSSTGDEREMAKSLSMTLVKEFSVLFEGQEKQDFWKNLPGNENYSNCVRLAIVPLQAPAVRLFCYSKLKGGLKVEEIMDFSQSDLAQEDIFILDAFHTLMIWTGKYANREEKNKAFEIAIEFLKTDPSRREPNIPIIHVKQGYEPPTFTGFFTEWDPQMWMKEQKFEELREEIDRQKPLLQVDLIVADTVPNFYECEKYPLNVLLERDPEKLPVGIDVQHKELYLSSEEFFDVFSMKYSEYSGIPKWKQDCLKKNVGLF